MKIASWNVNGIRACHRKGFMKFVKPARFDVILLQEVRAEVNQIPDELLECPGYYKAWVPARTKKGYSGVGLLSKEEPKKVIEGIGRKKFDDEGRVITAEFRDCRSNLHALSNSSRSGSNTVISSYSGSSDSSESLSSS